jgi:hypothetical protein
MRISGLLVAAVVATAGVATESAASGDSVRGSGVFTLSWPTNSPWLGYQVKVNADATSDANGENASGRFTAQITKKGASGKSIQVSVDCLDVSDASGPTWTSYHAIVGGTVRKDKDGYRALSCSTSSRTRMEDETTGPEWRRTRS